VSITRKCARPRECICSNVYTPLTGKRLHPRTTGSHQSRSQRRGIRSSPLLRAFHTVRCAAQTQHAPFDVFVFLYLFVSPTLTIQALHACTLGTCVASFRHGGGFWHPDLSLYDFAIPSCLPRISGLYAGLVLDSGGATRRQLAPCQARS